VISNFLVRGALVEYSTDIFGPLPNIVVFQFNPDEIARTITVPRPAQADPKLPRQQEPGQTSAPPVESFRLTAKFSAVDDLADGGPGAVLPSLFGVGPQLAALEKMVYPASGLFSGALGAVVDAIGAALGAAGGAGPESRPIPRETVPRLLFVWGPSRVLPVTITSMVITEKQYDPVLNPVLAEVQLGLDVASLTDLSDDPVAEGALKYTQTVKDAQATANLAQSVELALDIIAF
jgi:hypothetical protein